MKILCLDTTTEYIVLALQNGSNKDYYVSEKGCKKHNSILLQLIDEFLIKNELRIIDVDVFAVAVGPGSFTGIRVGVATVNALAFALNKKVVEIITLELPVKMDKVMSLLDCKHDNFYCGIFDKEIRFAALTKEEVEKFQYEKIYMNGPYEKELLEKCIKKVQQGLFVQQARPFYIKKSSAEIEEALRNTK